MPAQLEFITERANLARGIAIVGKSIAGQTTLPALNHILLEGNQAEQTLTMTATNLAQSATCTFAAEITQAGGITVPAKLFADWVSKVPDAPVRGQVDPERALLTLRSGRFHSQFNGYPAEEFPTVDAQANDTPPILFAPDLLHQMAETVAIAASDKMSRPAWAGVNLNIDPSGRLRWIATDSYHLARLYQDTEVRNALNITIPATSLTELNRILDAVETDQSIRVWFRPTQAVFDVPGTDLNLSCVRFTAQPLAFKYPEVESFIPREWSTQAIFERKELLQAVTVASLFAQDEGTRIKLMVRLGIDGKPSTVRLESGSDIGENQAELEVEAEGKPLDITFKSTYLLDMLKAITAERVAMQATTAAKPALFLPVPSDGCYTHLITPMGQVAPRQRNTDSQSE